MSEEYAPTLKEIVDGYVEWKRSLAYSDQRLPEPVTETYAKVKKALDQHDREVAAKALEPRTVHPSSSEFNSLVESLADDLAYYFVRETNPKADDPIFGYATFSEDQKQFLREKKREAAEEMARHVVQAAAKAWDEGNKAAEEDSSAPDWAEATPNPYKGQQ